ncbi:DUF4271 domain-containing protein [Robiginitalea sp. IMCC43444]|uniref:DUF4271 domain-containing protein n=1 Tax=Robiginitalea sp. IMCC43444 TaxID=3459121 RepID=UPI00404199D2
MEALERSIPAIDWITAVLFLGLLCLVFAKSFFYSRFLNFIILPFNNKYLFLYNKKGLLLNGFHLALSLFSIISMGLFLSLGSAAFFEDAFPDTAVAFLYFTGGVFIFLFLKFSLQLTAGYIFNTDKLMESLVFIKSTYFNYSALIMFLASVFLAYMLPGNKSVVLTAIFLIILINAIGWIALLKIHQKLIALHFFYFILYLCTLEIAPFLLVLNLLKD